MSITIEIIAEQDDTPVRGNALASDDVAADRACEDEILARLDSGDVWAWAFVRVRVTCGDFAAEDSLGNCNYADESDFKRGPYYADMLANALDNLQAQLDAAAKLAKTLATQRRDLLLAMTGKRGALETLVWKHTHRDLRSEAGETKSIVRGGLRGSEIVLLSSLSDTDLVRELPQWLRAVVPS